MKLISMTDFILQHKNLVNKSSVFDFATLAVNYAEFLKQPLKLSMFFPCDEDGKLLEKPKEHLEDRGLYYKELEQYQKGLKNVFFDGFRVEDKESNKFEIAMFSLIGFGTIEDLLKLKSEVLTLTESAIKQWKLS